MTKLMENSKKLLFLRHFRDPVAWYQRFGWKLGVSPHPLLEPQRVWNHVGVCREVVSLYRSESCRDDIGKLKCNDSCALI